MKIAFLFGSLNRGGLETLLLDVFRKLKKTDFDAVALYRKDGVLRPEFEKTDVQLTNLPVGKNVLAYLWKLRKYFLKNGIAIAHAQQPLDALFAYFASIGTKTKVALTLHGFDFEDGGKQLLNFMLKRTAVNTFVSNFQKKYYTEKYRLKSDKQIVIYNGIDFSKLNFKSDKHKGTLRKELKLADSTFLMGMVGNFNRVRDQFFICRFLKEMKTESVDFHFIFIGKRIESSAERFDNCVEFCKENDLLDSVSFLGVRGDVPQILSQLDAFVYATEHDTFGIAVVEAIASDIPVFVNDWDVMKEITEEGKLANLYKTNNEYDLLEKIKLFLQNREKYEQQAVENAKIVKEKYSIEKHIEGLRDLYDGIL